MSAAIGFAGGVVLTVLVAIVIWPKGEGKAVGQAARAKPVDAEEVVADGPPEKSSKQDLMHLCKNVGEYARTVMESRQNGVPMSKLIELAASAEADAGPTMQQIIIEAYDYPRMSVEANKATATVDFENKVYLECTKAMLKK